MKINRSQGIYNQELLILATAINIVDYCEEKQCEKNCPFFVGGEEKCLLREPYRMDKIKLLKKVKAY